MPRRRVRFLRANARVWLVVSLLVISAIFNAGIAPHHLVIGLYLFPILFAAHYGGRRYALFTAGATVIFVVTMTHTRPSLFAPAVGSVQTRTDAFIWAAVMVVTAYLLGTFADHRERYLRELRETYHGVLRILSHFLSKDAYTETHSYRVSVYATAIAGCLGLSEDEIEDIRAASLLHDIGKLEVSRDLLYKAARLSEQEYQSMMQHVDRGAEMLSPVGGALSRVIPIVLAHHDKYNGTGPHQVAGENIPIGARILAVADVYDALISDRPYRKAMAPFEAKESIQKASGVDFDPEIVEAFLTAFKQGRLETSREVAV